jgi:hypothetical protein
MLNDQITYVLMITADETAKSTVNPLFPLIKYGSVSKPCTPVVHIKIAGLAGCSFP